ncbi:unnamed protein product, partial [marine sediment metagenome]
PEYISQYDLIGTDYSQDYWNANSPSTYYMPDSLGWIVDREDLDNNDDDLSREYDAFILGEVAENMALYGYQRVDELDVENPPDVYLFTQAIAVKNTTVGYVPGYPWYGGYYPGWGGYWPGYGGYYPGWGGSTYSYSYTTGTILIEMGDAKNIDMENKVINIVWTAGIDGILGSTSASNAQFVSQSIEQAFIQSPYLKN